MHTQLTLFLLLLLIVLLPSIPCGRSTTPSNNPPPRVQRPCLSPQSHHRYAFCNTLLPLETRAKSLISLFSLDEKIQQLCNNASAVPRLGIPSYQWWSESLHGIASNGPGISFNGTIRSATGFPQVIVAAAAFNRSLWSAVASAIAVEARAMHALGQAGLTYFAPEVNIFRDPRWGRGQETPGEDPMVVAAYAVEYVRALQGQEEEQQHFGGDLRSGGRLGMQRRVLRDDRGDGGGGGGRLKLSACCKHLNAYDMEKWKQFTRYNFNAVVTDQDMADTYQVPFKSCILEGKASCLMCSYNSINGIPACANHDLLQKARNDWNFKGYITSDCDAVATIFEYQKYAKSAEDAVALALRAGTDINCGTYMLRHMRSAFDKGKVSEEDVDKALFNLFSVQLRLGLFDGESGGNHFEEFGSQDVCTSQHQKLALETAKQGIVLLKNEQRLLPLDKHRVSSLAVIGPMANTVNLGGGYTGVPCNSRSILDEFKVHINNVYYAAGCEGTVCNSSTGFSEAVSIAKRAEYVILVVGLNLTQETEDLDRYSLLLPGYQMALVNAVAEVSKKPIILVLTGGGPIDVSFAVGKPSVGGILWIGYPGEAGGEALTEIVFGHYNPGGRLPITWYLESFTSVQMNDMNMRPDPSRNYPGRTYRFYTGDTVFPFGYGLSYTNFSYKLLSAPQKLHLPESIKTRRQVRSTLYKGGNDNLVHVPVNEIPRCSMLKFQIQVSVTNKGDIDGSEVVLLYSRMSKAVEGYPQKQLIGFERVSILSNKSAETSFLVEPCEHLSVADESGNRILPLGDHVLFLEGIQHVISIGF